jgi:hypothetical protein
MSLKVGRASPLYVDVALTHGDMPQARGLRGLWVWRWVSCALRVRVCVGVSDCAGPAVIEHSAMRS